MTKTLVSYTESRTWMAFVWTVSWGYCMDFRCG